MLKKSLLAFAALAFSANAFATDLPTVKIGATPTAVPFNFLDSKTNTLQGVMIDLSNALGEELGFKPDIMSIPFASLVPSLQTDRIALISSAFAMTPARAEVVDFSDVVVTYGEAMVVNAKDTTAYTSVDELAGKTVGVQIGTAYVDPVNAVSGLKEVKMYDTMSDMIRDVSLGRIDAAIGDGPTMSHHVNTQGIRGVRYVDSYETTMPTQIALAVKKGDADFLERLNKGLESLREKGTLEDILTKWNIKQ